MEFQISVEHDKPTIHCPQPSLCLSTDVGKSLLPAQSISPRPPPFEYFSCTRNYKNRRLDRIQDKPNEYPLGEHFKEAYVLALQYLNDKQFKKALSVFGNMNMDLIPSKGTKAMFLYNVSLCHFGLGEYKLSLKYLEAGLQWAPRDSLEIHHFMLLRIKCAIHLNQFHDAIFFCNQALKETKENHYVYLFRRAMCFRAIHKHEKALNDVKRSLLLNPMHMDAYELLGLLLRDQKKMREALTVFTMAKGFAERESCTSLVKDTQLYLYRILNNRGTIYSELKENEKAVEDYTAAIEIYDKDAKPWFNRGTAYHEMGAYHLSIQDYKRSIELNPNHIKSYFSLGVLYYALGDYDSALFYYTMGIENQPNYAPFYNGRGDAFSQKKMYHKAIADYSVAIQLDPKDYNSYVNRGLSRYYLKQHDLSMEDYTIAIALNPKLYHAYLNRGLVYYAIGVYEDSIDDYSKGIQMNPTSARAYCCRALAYVHSGNHEDAQKDIEKAKSLDPKNSIVRFYMGKVKYHMKEYQKSIEHFTEALTRLREIEIKEDPWQLGRKNALISEIIPVRMSRAAAYVKIFNIENAMKDYQWVIDHDPSNWKARKKIMFLKRDTSLQKSMEEVLKLMDGILIHGDKRMEMEQWAL